MPGQHVLLGLTMAGCLLLAGAALVPRPRGRLQGSLAAGMLGFALETLAIYALLVWTESPEDRLLWLRAWMAAGLLLLGPWLVFGWALSSPGPSRSTRVAILAALGAIVAGAAAATTPAAFDVAEVSGAFYAARLTGVGAAIVALQLATTVGILAGLERALRGSRGAARWRIKYLVLGLGGIFLVRFFLLTQVLMFQVVLATFMSTAAATLLLGSAAIGFSMARGLVPGDVTVSRHVVYRSVVVGVLGLYLFVVGALGWVLDRVGVPETTFWGSLVVFVSALALAAVLLSETVRWRLKRFIALNFYRSKYDYREQWITFTKRLGSLLSLEEVAPQLLGAVTEAAGAARGLLYLVEPPDGRHRLIAAVEVDRAPASLAADTPLAARLRDIAQPVVVDNGSLAMEPLALLGDAAVLVPLRWRGTLTGAMLIGPERTGRAYGLEDLEFLATVGEQAAGAIITARLSETAARSREFEAFTRLTSFVIHDIKNSVTALSMLSQNALTNFDDREFQQDAIRTLSRTVDRMRGLLARLSASPEPTPLRLEPVDLSALAVDAIQPLRGRPDVRLVRDLTVVEPVLGDREALGRVVQNLVTNAVEALEGHGGEVAVRTYAEGDHVALAVSDTGCGIEESFLRGSLFSPFKSTKKGGWGIGLYQSRTLVEAHGGSIDVTSTQGEGTTFVVRLPRTR